VNFLQAGQSSFSIPPNLLWIGPLFTPLHPLALQVKHFSITWCSFVFFYYLDNRLATPQKTKPLEQAPPTIACPIVSFPRILAVIKTCRLRRAWREVEVSAPGNAILRPPSPSHHDPLASHYHSAYTELHLPFYSPGGFRRVDSPRSFRKDL